MSSIDFFSQKARLRCGDLVSRPLGLGNGILFLPWLCHLGTEDASGPQGELGCS